LLSAAVSPELVVCGGLDGSVHMYEMTMTGALVPRPARVVRPHTKAITCVAVCAVNDVLVSGSTDGTAVVCHLRSGQPRVRLTPLVHNGDKAASAGSVTWVGVGSASR